MVARKQTTGRLGAAEIVASTFGILAGIGGITHGIGEILQGNVAPDGIFFDSWTFGPIAVEMDGDPALSLIPNLLITGALTVVVSGLLMGWAAMAVRRKDSGRVMMLLSVAMLLVGGGVGAPVIGLLASAAAWAAHAPLTWWRTHMADGLRRLLATLWPWVYGVALVNGLFLFGGALLLFTFVSFGNSDIFLNSFYFAVLSVLLSAVTSVAYDLEHQTPRGHGVGRRHAVAHQSRG